MKTVSWILALYPRGWRERYQEEMLALLEEYTITLKTIFDLLLGALDARLDPSYRAKEGFIFQRIHDVRFLSYIYVSALAIFLVAINCWTLTISTFSSWFMSFNFSSTLTHDASMGAFIVGIGVVMIICFFTLLGSALSMLWDAFKNRSFGIVLFALLCLGLSILVVSASLTAEGVDSRGIVGRAIQGSLVLLISVSFFVAGIKGLKMLRNRQSSPVLFAILIGLIAPFIFVLYEAVGLSFVMSGLYTWQEIIVKNSGQFLPYIPISALLLMLADVAFNRRNWRLIRGFGVFLALLLTVEAAVVVICDVSCWLRGVEAFGLMYGGTWTFFTDQGFIMLITNAFILLVMLALIVSALLRAFVIPPNRRVISQPRTA